MADPIDLGDGRLCMRAGGVEFSVDPVSWIRWIYDGCPKGATLFESIDAARKKLIEEGGPELGDTQVDAFIHAIQAHWAEVKKKRDSGPT